MIKYIAIETISINSVYGKYNLVKGCEVPVFLLNGFRKYIETVVIEEPKEEEPVNIEPKKNKKGELIDEIQSDNTKG